MKKRPTTYTTIREIEIDLDIDVVLLNSRIFTTKDLSTVDNRQKSEKGKKYLCISIEIQLDDFESVSDSAAYARPRFLILLGILTFLTQELFTPFEFYSKSIVVGNLKKGKRIIFKFNKSNYLSDFNKIAAFSESHTENEKRLFFSLIDRYRKALYLENESEESMIHDDEVLLSYFHILELLSTRYYSKQKQLATKSIKQFSENILKDIYLLEGNHLQSEQSSKCKLIESIFISELPVASKIMFMFKEQGILTHRLKAFISDLVKDRNSVAHGRQVYQEKVIFPVPPFFPLIRNREYSFDILRILSGRSIASFLDLDYLKEDWADLDLPPSIDELNRFISEKRYDKIKIADFYAGIDNDITPYIIEYYLLSKKLKIENAIAALSDIILNYRKNKDEITKIVLSVLLIVDKANGELKNKCIEIIKLSSENGWLPDLKMRDLLYYLEYLGHEPKTFRAMITKREIR
ncbi:MAG: hypothetical protein FGM14_10935 [Flavobacteriales bacterium]|nr:hypothetical protein [Flavobacteriales bacterium]